MVMVLASFQRAAFNGPIDGATNCWRGGNRTPGGSIATLQPSTVNASRPGVALAEGQDSLEDIFDGWSEFICDRCCCKKSGQFCLRVLRWWLAWRYALPAIFFWVVAFYGSKRF